MNTITGYDLKLLELIKDNLHSGFLDKLLPIITRLGDNGVVPIIIAVILIIIPKTRKTGIAMGIAFALGGIIGNLILKNAVGRIRPYYLVKGTELLIKPFSDYSFPSGHTLILFELATVLIIREKRYIGIISLIVAFTVAFSRLYLFVHYPTDVLAGMILGAVFGIIGCITVKKLSKRKNKM